MPTQRRKQLITNVMCHLTMTNNDDLHEMVEKTIHDGMDEKRGVTVLDLYFKRSADDLMLMLNATGIHNAHHWILGAKLLPYPQSNSNDSINIDEVISTSPFDIRIAKRINLTADELNYLWTSVALELKIKSSDSSKLSFTSDRLSDRIQVELNADKLFGLIAMNSL